MRPQNDRTVETEGASAGGGVEVITGEKMGEVSFEKRQLLGFLGAGALVIGVFAPVIQVPIVGNLSYVADGRGDGMFVLLLAVIAAVLIYLRKYQWVWLPTLAIGAICSLTFVRVEANLGEARDKMNSDLAGNPFRGLADAFANSVGLGWGWGLLILGLLGLVAAAGMPPAVSIHTYKSMSVRTANVVVAILIVIVMGALIGIATSRP